MKLIAADVKCLDCGYCLKGISPESKCPECGSDRVSEAVRRFQLKYVTPLAIEQRQALSKTVRYLLALTLAPVAIIIVGATASWVGLPVPGIVLRFALAAVFLAGSWCVYWRKSARFVSVLLGCLIASGIIGHLGEEPLRIALMSASILFSTYVALTLHGLRAHTRSPSVGLSAASSYILVALSLFVVVLSLVDCHPFSDDADDGRWCLGGLISWFVLVWYLWRATTVIDQLVLADDVFVESTDDGRRL